MKRPRISSQHPRKVRKAKLNKNNGLRKPSSQSSQKERKNKNSNIRTKLIPSDLTTTTKTPKTSPKKSSRKKSEESVEAGSKYSKTKNIAILTPPGSNEKSEDGVFNGPLLFQLSLIDIHPINTRTTALAKVERFSLGQFEHLKASLSIVEAFASVCWKNNTPIKDDFDTADSITVDWDTPDHSTKMPAIYKNPGTAIVFIESLLLGTDIPLPNFFYVTEHGIRMTWVLAKPITNIDRYHFISLKLAADLGADFNAARSTTIFKSKKHIESFGLHLIHSQAFDSDEYASLPPTWAMDGDDELYIKALEHFNLILDQSAPSLNCPLGGHSGNNSTSVRAYAKGVSCFSGHGYIRKSKVVELAGLSQSRVSLYELVKNELNRFASKGDLLSLLSSEIKRRMNHKNEDAKRLAKLLFDYVLAALENDTESQWSYQFEYFHHKKYPYELREYCGGPGLRQLVYPESNDSNFEPTYFIEKFDFRDFPGAGSLEMPHLKKLTSPLFFMTKEKPKKGDYVLKAHTTAEMSRFRKGENKAVLKSSLYDLQPYIRPVAGIQSGWKLEENRLPCRIITPDLLYKGSVSLNIVEELCTDLKTHFAFEKQNMIYQYLGYLIQAMVCHNTPGQNPVYYFKGPTHSGKGYLGNVFVGMIYCTQYGPGCHETNFKSGGYELDILMGKATHYPYMVFDEIAYVSLKELKFIDRLATQQQIEVRKLHFGYATIPNHITVAMTAINREFSDETKARLVEITLIESRAENIKKFHGKWSKRTQELIAALYYGVSKVDFTQAIPDVEHRRTGFGIIKKGVEEGLRIDTFKPCVEYPISQGPSHLLDIITLLFETGGDEKNKKGSWSRYTPRKIAEFYNSKSSVQMKAEYMQANLTTTLLAVS